MSERYYVNVGGIDWPDNDSHFYAIKTASEIAVMMRETVKCYDANGKLCYTIDAQGNVKKED